MRQVESTQVAIIGAGVHGTALAARLARERFRDFVLIDAQAPMQGWFDATEAMGLDKLRTPSKLHIGPAAPGHMLATMRHGDWTEEDLEQPATVAEFNGYAKKVIKRYDLQRTWVQAWAQQVVPIANGGYFVTAQTPNDGVRQMVAENVVVAVGLGRAAMLELGPYSPRIRHGETFDVREEDGNWWGERVCVVGGGLSAGTLAVSIAQSAGTVVLCVPERLTVSQLEADPMWLPGGELWEAFRDAEEEMRLRMLKGARVGRGVTPEVYHEIQERIASGNLELMENTRLKSWFLDEDGKVLIPEVDESFDALFCATGYQTDVTQLGFLASLQEELQVIEGLPVLDDDYEATGRLSGLYFMGRLAELSGGPLARNLPGARHATEEIAKALLERNRLTEDEPVEPGTTLDEEQSLRPRDRERQREMVGHGGCG